MARKASKDGMGARYSKEILMASSALSLVLLLSYLAPWHKLEDTDLNIRGKNDF